MPEMCDALRDPGRSTAARARAAILAVLLLAAALRWAQPGLVEFKYDEANITRMALGLAGGGRPPLLSGGTTLGVQRPALDVYLMALPLALIGRHIEAAVWWLGALGVVAVALTYLLGRQVGGRGVGLMAALFMATNPWLIAYDRKLWAHIQVVFSVLLLLLAWQVVVAGRRRAGFWFPVVAALQGLTHTLAVVQILSWLAALLAAPRRWRRREVSLGLLVGAGLLIPYVVALAVRWTGHTAAEAAAAVPLASESAPQALQLIRGAWVQAFHLFTGSGISSLVGLTSASSFVWRATDFLAVPVALTMAGGLFRVALWPRGGPHAQGARLLLAWMVGPILILSLGVMQVAIQYWTVLLPLPALFLALGLDGIGAWLARWFRVQWVRVGLSGAALVLAVVWAGSYGVTMGAVSSGAGAKAFGVPLSRWQETLATTRDWAARLGTQEVRVAVDGVDPGYDGEPATVAMLIGSPPWARFVSPQQPAALLLAHERPSLYLWAIRDAGTEALLNRVGELVWESPLGAGHADARLYHLPPAGSADLGIPLVRLSPEPVFDAGMALVGYAFPETIKAEEPAEVTLIWRVLAPSPEVRQRDFTAFNHVITGAEERAAQVDGLALLSRDWWPGDVLLQRYEVVVPEPGAYRWRVGLYSRADGGRSQVSTGGDHVDLGPLIVR